MSLWTGRDAGVTGDSVQHHEGVNGTSHKRDRLRPMVSSQITPFARRVWRIARTEITALAALFVVAAGIMTFVELAGDVSEADGGAFDQAVLLAVRPGGSADGWGPPWLETAALDLTSLGGISVLGLFGLIVVVFLILQRKQLSALLLVLGLAGGVVLSEGLKAVFGRDRPPAAWQAVETINASFPSGHALLSAVFYLSIGVMLTRAFPRRRFKAYVLGVALLLTLIVGLTRVYLAAHWASDVLAGWSVGAAWAMALWLVAYAVQRRQAGRAGGPHDETLPGEAINDTDPRVIGE
jgi:undecaprenyl-diphosphatase